MFDEKTGVKLISSARHALLNDLQLIKGYLYMQQPEKANLVMDRMTDNLRNQARLSHLQIPKCTFFLVTYSWAPHSFQLSFEVSGPEKNLAWHDQELTEFFQKLLLLLEEQASEMTDNFVRILFEIEESAVNVHVIHTGKLIRIKEAQEKLMAIKLHQSLKWVKHYITNDSVNGRTRWVMCLSIK
ncbi:Spo0B C-terminal domain-containing protein [Sporolactobacillus putidus]|uniref:Sporulation initiation phosphotransferase B C-terminal domain-containing protein n=1 Tax=Sporolactobacillus putidus TaxID=492735 RepID=A0A917RXQ4_9BACL|nr:Spo0B C-terminal domain-containing protein [Sporolactobacillus putidus]GGL41145.1 hypothetical protein GCM10007968_01300 [Sporolactobacillus putidus]